MLNNSNKSKEFPCLQLETANMRVECRGGYEQANMNASAPALICWLAGAAHRSPSGKRSGIENRADWAPRMSVRVSSRALLAFCCLRRVLDPHCDVEPVKNGWHREPGIDQGRSQTGTAVGERGDFSVVGSADGSKALSDQRRDVCDSLRARSEHLPPSTCSFNISDADLQVPFTLFATTDERQIHADGDRCCCRSCRLVRGCSSKLLADPQRMVAQGLGASAGINGQQVLQDVSGDAIGHQGGKVSLR